MRVENLSSESNESRLSIKEAFLIKDQKPVLDDKRSAIEFYLFS